MWGGELKCLLNDALRKQTLLKSSTHFSYQNLKLPSVFPIYANLA